METHSFLLLSSLTIAFLGSFFLAKGILWLTPEFMYQVSRTIFGGNPLITKTFVIQKSDYICGIICLIFALIIQYFDILIENNFQLFDSLIIGIIYIILITLLIFVIITLIRKKLIKVFESKVEKYWVEKQV